LRQVGIVSERDGSNPPARMATARIEVAAPERLVQARGWSIFT